MDLFAVLLLTLGAFGSISGQMLELPVQDQVPKSLVTDCPNTPYPVVMSSMTSLEVWANQYVVCLRSVPLIFNCSQGLFFNPDKLTCEPAYERRSILYPHEEDIPDRPQYPVPINPDLRENILTKPWPRYQDILHPRPEFRPLYVKY